MEYTITQLLKNIASLCRSRSEFTFTGKSGDKITITYNAPDDFEAWFRSPDSDDSDPCNGYSVRGSLTDIITEVKSEV